MLTKSAVDVLTKFLKDQAQAFHEAGCTSETIKQHPELLELVRTYSMERDYNVTPDELSDLICSVLAQENTMHRHADINSPNHSLAMEMALDQFLHTGNTWSAIQSNILELYPDLTEADIDAIKAYLDYRFEQFKIRIKSCKCLDLIPGGKGDGRCAEEFDQDELSKGTKHEMEHTNNPSFAQEIAKDHLTEDPKYYTHLDTFEKKAGESGAEGARGPARKEIEQELHDTAAQPEKPISTGPDVVPAYIDTPDQQKSDLKPVSEPVSDSVVQIFIDDVLSPIVEAFGLELHPVAIPGNESISLELTLNSNPFARLVCDVEHKTIAMSFTGDMHSSDDLAIFKKLDDAFVDAGFSMTNKLNQSLGMENLSVTKDLRLDPKLVPQLLASYPSMIAAVSTASGVPQQTVALYLAAYYGQDWKRIEDTLTKYSGLWPSNIKGTLSVIFQRYKTLSSDAFEELLSTTIAKAKAQSEDLAHLF